MLICSEGNSKLNPLKKAELEQIDIDMATVDFTGLNEYSPRVEYEGGGNE